MVDLATDINVIRVYLGEEGQEWYGWMMLGMVLASLFIQLLVVVLQNGARGGAWKLLKEVLIVLSGLKPGVDAMRVVADVEMDEHQMVDAKMELVLAKAGEMFAESIPGESSLGAACEGIHGRGGDRAKRPSEAREWGG
jgi:hypothetical protein